MDQNGFAYVTGRTISLNFPTTPRAFDESYNGEYDAFVVKLVPDGTDLSYSTLVGGSLSDEAAYTISVDTSGRAYVAGWASQSDFPTTTGAFDETWNGGADGFVLRLTEGGSSLDYATFFGGRDSDRVCAISIDDSGTAYVSGTAWSSGFPTTVGAFDETHNGSMDVFVASLSSSGDDLNYSTFLGGSRSEGATSDGYTRIDIDVDNDGSAYLYGVTNLADFPITPGAFDELFNGTEAEPWYDAFVTKLASDGGDGFVSKLEMTRGPIADFSADLGEGIVPLVVSFADRSSGTVTTYSWDFGDGGASSLQHPTHTYTHAGAFSVTLVATGPGGRGVEFKPNCIIVHPQRPYLPLVLPQFP